MTSPELSILMVTFGARDWAERALEAVHANTDVPFEVIVVDNGSADGTPEMIAERFPDVQLVRNEENAGFGRANNQAAALARAPVLALVNSDAIVPAGWAPPLLEQLARDGIGVVVPALVHDDGRLQAAGAVLGADGSVLGLGDGEDPADPAYAFPRICDFGAAACMLLRRDAFEAVGGFDTRYHPAYFEDVDLCMSLAARGWQTLYDPRVRVLHGVFGSGGHEQAADLFWRNREPFLERWGAELVSTRVPTVWPVDPARTLAARDALTLGRVLVLCGDELPVSDSELAALCDPGRRLRVTLVAAGGDGAAWLARGAEVLVTPDPETIVRGRAGHYDVIVGVTRAVADAVREHQPQAVIGDTVAAGARLVRELVQPPVARGPHNRLG